MNRLQIFSFGIVSIIWGWFLTSKVDAQGILTVSNLGESSSASETVASDAWLAVSFRTGHNPGGYLLNSVSLSMGEASGSPDEFSFSLYYDFGEESDQRIKISDLTGPNPSNGGILAYDGMGIFLLPFTNYSGVLTADTFSDIGSYSVRVSNTGNYTAYDDGWTIWGFYLASSNGSDWNFPNRLPLQYAIYATPIPTVSIDVADDQIEIRWEGFEDVAYQMQTRASLTGSEWTDVGEPLTGDASEIIVPVTVTSGESQSYYRVEVLPAEPASE